MIYYYAIDKYVDSILNITEYIPDVNMNITKINNEKYNFRNKMLYPKNLTKNNNIVKYIHFIIGLNTYEEFKLIYFIAIISAFKVNNPEYILIHYGFEPYGQYYNTLKTLSYIKFIPIGNIKYPYGIKHYTHKCNYLKLLILYKYSGLYLDIDTISIKPVNEIIKYGHVTICNQRSNYGFSSGFLYSIEKSSFIKEWIKSYEFFDDTDWDYNGVKFPKYLSSRYPNINILNEYSFSYPMWEDIYILFSELNTLKSITEFSIIKNILLHSYCIHLWESWSFQYKIMESSLYYYFSYKFINNLKVYNIKVNDSYQNIKIINTNEIFIYHIFLNVSDELNYYNLTKYIYDESYGMIGTESNYIFKSYISKYGIKITYYNDIASQCNNLGLKVLYCV